jgi:FkbM family methyltransferase
MNTKLFLESVRKIRRRIEANLYYSPPNLRLTFLNIFGFQVLRFYCELVRFRFMRSLWKPHDINFSASIKLNGYFKTERFLDLVSFKQLKENIETIVERERVATGSKLTVFKDEIAIRLNIDERYLNSVKGRLDSLAWEIWDAVPFDTVLHHAEDVNCSTEKSARQFEIEYISVPHNGVDHYDHNTWWHADRHFHCGKAFFFINDHEQKNGTYEFFPHQNQSILSRTYYEYIFSVRWYLRYVLSGFNSTKMLEKNIAKPRVSDFEYRLLGLRSSPVVAPQNTLLVSDNISFHRRGKLSPGTKRVNINFTFYKNRLSLTNYVVLKLYLQASQIYKSINKGVRFCALKASQIRKRVYRLDNGIRMQPVGISDDKRFHFIFNGRTMHDYEYVLFKKASAFSDVVLDVGANYGMFTFGLHPLPKDKSVHAFEPNPRLCESMSLTLSSNNLDPKQFIINNLGVADIDSELTFNINRNWSGSSTFRHPTRSFEHLEMNVKVTKLDSYLDNNKIVFEKKTVLIKIDVEGFDLKALLGAEKILRECSDYLLIIELDGQQFIEDVSASSWFDFLFSQSEFRYAIFTDGMTKINSREDLSSFFCRNLSEHVDVVLATEKFASVFYELN